MSRSTGTLALAAGAALLVVAPSPPESVATLHALATGAAPLTLGNQTDPLAGVLAVAALGAWFLVAYLTLVVALTCATRLPRVDVLAAGALRRVAPAALRSAVAVALGAAVVVGSTSAASAATPPSAAGSATASHAPMTMSVSDPDSIGDLDWPVAPPDAGPAVASPAATAEPPPSATPSGPVPTGQTSVTPSTRPHPASVPLTAAATPDAPAAAVGVADAGQLVVQDGDTLWGLAASTLPADASEAAVAAAWPTWWEANRAVIGEDPDQLSPGQVLQAPA